MGKWTTIYTNGTATKKSDAEKRATDKVVNKMLRNTVKRNPVEMKKESDACYAAKVARDESLLAAYDAKKLKSPALIKEAKALAAARDKKADKKAVATA
jgi:hypothetical protein